MEAHAKEVSTLKTYTHFLEEQQSQRTLHHTSSNHLLLMLDTAEPRSPTKENTSQPQTAGPSATSIRSFQTAFEDPQRPSQESTCTSPEMQALKRRLSSAKKPDIGPIDVVMDRDRLRQANQALERQVEALMSKLNQSRKAERALQNTVDNLEARLELANVEKVDALEEHHNLQVEIREMHKQHRSLSRHPESLSQQSARPNADQLNVKLKEAEAQVLLLEKQLQAAGGQTKAPSTIATFIEHIERLQDQVKEKESRINDLEQDNQLRRLDIDDHEHRCNELLHENTKLKLQEEIHAKLSEQAKEADAEISELKSTIRRMQKELEYHVLLLQAEIRRKATLAILTVEPDDQAARSLASKADVDRMIEGLQKRLKAHMSADSETKLLEQSTDLESQIKLLKKENEYYVREIMYYKLDVRGYKKDIKELKRTTNRGQNVRSEANSPNPQACYRSSAGTPVRSRFNSAAAGGLGISASSSPTSAPMSASNSFQPSTPATSAAPSTPHLSPSRTTHTGPGAQKRAIRAPSPKSQNTPMTPQTPPRRPGRNPANDADNSSPGISPRSVSRLSPSRTKPTPPSPDAEQKGDMATNFPLSTPAAPQRVDTQRSMSDSIITMYATARTPDWSPPKSTPGTGATPGTGTRSRSGSLPGPGLRSRSGSGSAPGPGPVATGKMTPERPPRPRYGLFESPKSSSASVPVKMDVMAEAERHSPHRAHSRSASSLSTQRQSQMQAPSQLPRGSAVDTSKIPFVIAMGSPHNPALNLGVGIGGSMASRTGEAAHNRTISAPRCLPGASSGIPTPGALGKGKGKARKEIISSPAFFGPAFGMG